MWTAWMAVVMMVVVLMTAVGVAAVAAGGDVSRSSGQSSKNRDTS